MKLIHTGDLHIGITVNGYNMSTDQDYILSCIINIAKEEQADAVILAGDLYDRSVPSAEAVKLLDFFVSRLIKLGIKVIAIIGNHDSPERLSFANSIMKEQGFFIEGVFDGEIRRASLEDEYGLVNFYLLPYFRSFEADSMEDAVRGVIDKTKIDTSVRNVLVTHNFVTTGGRFKEEIVGNVDNVDAQVFDDFDYTALGHIHSSMKIGKGNVYYSGSPLKYSFSNVEKNKCVHVVELLEKGNIKVTPKDLIPLKDMRKITGHLKDLIKEEVVNANNPQDYICATLLNREELVDPIGVLRMVYPNIMQVIIDKNQTTLTGTYLTGIDIKNKSEIQLFKEFYLYVTGEEVEEEKGLFMESIIEKAKRGENI